MPSQSLSTHPDPLAQTFLYACENKGLKPLTLELYERCIRFFSNFINKPLSEANLMDALSYNHALRQDYEPRTVQTRVVVLNSFYQFLVTEQLMDTNPFQAMKVRIQPKAQLTATDDQVLQLMVRCAGSPSPNRNVSLVMLLADTGCRKEECSSLCEQDIDNRRIVFRVSKTKPRAVPLSSRLQLILPRWLDEREPHESLWNVDSPYRLVDYVVRVYSDGALTPHSLRRRFAINWLRQGGSETSLMRIAGWSSRAMISLYTQAYADDLACEEFERIFTT